MVEFTPTTTTADNDSAARARHATYFKPLRYDPDLVGDLLARYHALEDSVRQLAAVFPIDAEAGVLNARDCAERFHELRRWEAIRLYPFISRGVSGNAQAVQQWVVVRFFVNGLAHRVLRGIDELSVARLDVNDAVREVSANLAAYRASNESEIYPLYNLMDPLRLRASA